MEVVIPEKKVKELKEATEQLLSKTMVTVRALRTYTGQTNWVAGALPHSRWAVTILYAVITDAVADDSDTSKSRTEGRAPKGGWCRWKYKAVHVKRVETVLRWFWLLWSGVNGALVRRHRLGHRGVQAHLTAVVDACPAGIGGFLAESRSGRIVAWFADTLTSEDERVLQTERSAAGQGVFETLAVLIALKLWAGHAAQGRLRLSVKSDSITAISAVLKGCGRGRVVNALAAEIT